VAWAQPPLDTRALRWSNTGGLGEAGRALTKVNIPPGLAGHCDLVALAPAIVGDTPGVGAIAALQIDTAPVDRRHWIAGIA